MTVVVTPEWALKTWHILITNCILQNCYMMRAIGESQKHKVWFNLVCMSAEMQGIGDHNLLLPPSRTVQYYCFHFHSANDLHRIISTRRTNELLCSCKITFVTICMCYWNLLVKTHRTVYCHQKAGIQCDLTIKQKRGFPLLQFYT
jgi:hypothetical protein